MAKNDVVQSSDQMSEEQLEKLRAEEVNPLAKLAMAGAGIAVTILVRKAIARGWQLAFNENAPDKKMQKQSKKDLKAQQKAALKDGFDKKDVKLMKSEYDQIPAWRIALFTLISGVGVSALSQLARSGAQRGTEALISRRPRANRG